MRTSSGCSPRCGKLHENQGLVEFEVLSNASRFPFFCYRCLRSAQCTCYSGLEMSSENLESLQFMKALVDEYRHQCLWFLREDFYPETVEQGLRVLAYIQRYGDRQAYLKAAEARRWLLHRSKEKSATS